MYRVRHKNFLGKGRIMRNIVLISGSPSISSRSSKVLTYLGTTLEKESFQVSHISVQDIPLEDLFSGNYTSKVITDIAQQIQQAEGIIVASPVYKASYTGVLKTLLDIMPQDLFQSKPVLPIMTGGSPAHLLAIEYTLKPLIAILKGNPLRGVYILDSQINKEYEVPIIDPEIRHRLEVQTKCLIEAIKDKKMTFSQ